MAAFIPAGVRPPAGVKRDEFTPGFRMQDVLLNMFKERQGGFAGVPGEGTDVPGNRKRQGTEDAKLLPNSQGLLWGFLDPSWFLKPQKPEGMAGVVAEMAQPGGGGGGGGEPGGVTYDPSSGAPWPGPPWNTPPRPAPLGSNGHWSIVGTNQGGSGLWEWVDSGPPDDPNQNQEP